MDNSLTNNMWKTIRKYAWCVFLGGGFTHFSGYGLGNWEWWAFCIPVILLVTMRLDD